MGAGQVSAEVGLMEQPTLAPAIGGSDGKRKTPLVPNAVAWRASCDSADQLKKLARGHAGARDEVAPKN
jgi:hypothetical protein